MSDGWLLSAVYAIPCHLFASAPIGARVELFADGHERSFDPNSRVDSLNGDGRPSWRAVPTPDTLARAFYPVLSKRHRLGTALVRVLNGALFIGFAV